MKKYPFFIMSVLTAFLASACNETVNYAEENKPPIQCNGESFQVCNGVCRDLRHDNNHCGSCITVCKDNEVCSKGTCVAESQQPALSCADIGLADCNGQCVNRLVDVNNCGVCGNVCDPQEKCVSGSCTVPYQPECKVNTDCGDKQICEGGTCKDVSCTTDAHCGANEVCTAHECVPNVSGCASDTDCGDKQICEGGTCKDVSCTTDAHCSGGQICDEATHQCIDVTCSAPTPDNCSNVCVDLKTDVQHCGTCNTICGEGLSCLDGVCGCSDVSASLCGGVCVDVMTDINHCGACAHACSDSDKSCRGGICSPCDADGYLDITVDGDTVRAYCLLSMDDIDGLVAAAGSAYPDAGNTANAYVLMSDIDLGSRENWVGIKLNNAVFDGNAHTLSGKISSCASDGCGVFANVVDSTVVNVQSRVNVVSSHAKVGFIGEATGATIQGIRIDSHVTGSATIGGLVGSVKDSTILDCHGVGSVTGNAENTQYGGLIGYAENTTIGASDSAANVTGTTNVGGIVGEAVSSNIVSSYATGEIKTDTSKTDVAIVGGIAGVCDSGKIDLCYSTGNVSGTRSVGGVVGRLGGEGSTITRSMSTGDVICSEGCRAGGIAGMIYPANTAATISHVYAMGNVSSPTSFASGIVAHVRGINTGSLITHKISHAYFAGTVTGKYRSGILTFFQRNTLAIASLTNTYSWDGQDVYSDYDTKTKFGFDVKHQAMDEKNKWLGDGLNQGATTWKAARCLLKAGPGATTPDTYIIPVISEFSDDDLERMGCEPYNEVIEFVPIDGTPGDPA